MKKILVISDTEEKGFLYRVIEKLFLNESFYCSGNNAEELVNLYKPDYVYIDIIKPVNGEGMMSMLKHIDGNIRLRVAIFYLGYTKNELFKSRSFDRYPSIKEAAK